MIPIRSVVVSGVALSKINGEIKILLMKRNKGGFWCHVAGKVEAGETAWQAIIREFHEETVIDVQQLYSADYLEQFYEATLNVIELIPAFVVYCDDNQKITLNEEHSEYIWCSLDEALEKVVFAGQKKFYEYVWNNFVKRPPVELLKINIHRLL
ncbi:NUDIX hydrolase [Acinetobacter sp. ANC 4648]|uniref:NUDIX hydrolase n=1 Tax=Acinetobacter sp. ANC 4648 TaxID=1977875 RepID=UPI000A346175|nr:NUDIX domain-containing protein [Acinetobacter sp. ANC 4648]OTG84777.1 DNA mismatch repair protein MutT [Acinetobacter sp. ANC 4648]